MDESTLLTFEWGFNFLLSIVIGVCGFFVRRLSEDMQRRSEQIVELAQRIVVLEERERGSAEQISELKSAIDKLAADMRFVRESVVVLLNKAQTGSVGVDAGG